MTETLNWIFRIVLLAGSLLSVAFATYFLAEKEKTAALKILPVTLLLVLVVTSSFLFQFDIFFQLSVLVLFSVFSLLLFIPFGDKKIEFDFSKEPFDERDIMFSRMELEEGTQKFEDYYQKRPENKAPDDAFRKEPGLLQKGTKFYHPLLFNAAEASFSTVNLLHPLVEDLPKQKPDKNISEKNISIFIKKWALKLGAHSVGFTLLQPHHIYSHAGRGNRYGQSINLNHKFAVAFTVEMAHESMQHAPQGTAIMESAQQYLNAGQIAVQLATFIRNLGYEARAHIDANYQVVCPTVAQDAGLGTIGRMGLLMTPKLGPRVRIGVVTTNLQLPESRCLPDSSVLQFCAICKKCAVNCPSQAIPANNEQTEKGWRPWKINQEKCFTYWTKCGTDCGRCIAVCPYSHPNNLMHNMVRMLIRRNAFNRRLALLLDDFFYGKKPGVKPLKNRDEICL